MSSPFGGSNETISSTPACTNEVSERAPTNSSQPEDNTQGNEKDRDQVVEEVVIKRKRQKMLVVWDDFDEVEIVGGARKAVCKFCKDKFATGGKDSSTSHLKRHSENYLQRRLQKAQEKKQTSFHFNLLIQGGNFKRVLSLVKLHAPRRGIDVADTVFKCLKAWEIENKIFSVSVDNAAYNDSCLRNLKGNLSLSNKLFLDGALFHVRCCAHILNLLDEVFFATCCICYCFVFLP